VTLIFVVSTLVACTETWEGPLASTGSPNDRIGPVAVGQPRAWGLINFGREGVRATVLEVSLDTPLPEGLSTKIELNGGEPVPIGGIERPQGSAVRGLPGTISGPVQIVVWFEARFAGIEYFTRSTTIRYAINDQDYEASYPVGVGICSVERAAATTRCDISSASYE
jgi:hypothetical protein